MPLNIRYTDTRNQHEATCDPIQEKAIRSLIMQYLTGPWPFNDQLDVLHIDLSDDIETVTCYYQGRRTTSFGGAAAWNIYRCIASIWPEINQHTAGRPDMQLYTPPGKDY